MKLLDVKDYFNENTKKQIFEIKVSLPLLKFKNNPYFGMFMAEDLNGNMIKLPKIPMSSHDYLIDRKVLGKECTFIVVFDKSGDANTIGDYKRFCFGLRDFNIKWLPETFIWIDNKFCFVQDLVVDAKSDEKEIATTNELSLDKEVEVLDFPGLSLVEIEKEIEHKNDSPKNDLPDVLIKTDNKEESIQNESNVKEVVFDDVKKTFKPKTRKISAK
jgi:hypothetical protein